MSKRVAFLFPGQGAQYVGMAKDFFDRFSVARQVFEEAEDSLRMPVTRLIFEGPADELTLTKNSQVAIYIASIAVLRTVEHQFPDLHPYCCAGLSLGEYTALTAAGKIRFADCLDLVRRRGEAMHRACEEVKGTMQVVLSLSEEAVAEGIQGIDNVWIANLNCPGQVVIAGTIDGIAKAAEVLKQKGAKRILPLDVSGAFHSGLMRSAQEALREKIIAAPFKDSDIGIVMNVPGMLVSSSEEIKKFLIDQVASPVRWEKGIRAMIEEKVDLFIEMGPGKSLSGMNKRIGVEQPTLSIETVSDLESIQGVLCNC
jgi:[acyl-carrier-protein] S-malonyltransferase